MTKPFALLFAAALAASPLAHAQKFPKSVQKQAEERSSYPGTLSADSTPPIPQSLADRRAALNSVLTQLWQDHLARHPIAASVAGHHRYDADLPSYSASAFDAALDTGRQLLLRLSVIDTKDMTDEETLSDTLALRYLTAQQQAAQFQPWQMPITPYRGPQVALLRALPRLRFATVTDYDNYAARLAKLPDAIQQATNAADFGMEAGRIPPKFLLEQVLAQINSVAQDKPEAVLFAEPLQHFPASIAAADRKRITGEILTAIRTQVQPAYIRLGLFLKRSYVPAGRANAGLWSIPAGEAYYAYLLRQSTTTTLTPQQVHELALHQVAQDEAAMLPLAKKLGYKDLAALGAANPGLQVESREQLADAYTKAVAAMPAALPPFRRYARYNAFIDGWELYAVELAAPSDLHERLSQLELDRRHAALAVIDTGIHALHWTRPQAIDYLRTHTLLSDSAAGTDTDHVIARPARFAAATIGVIELNQLRALAQRSLGAKFSVDAFNRAVLASGPLPMDLLQQQVEQWIAAQKGSGK